MPRNGSDGEVGNKRRMNHTEIIMSIQIQELHEEKEEAIEEKKPTLSKWERIMPWFWHIQTRYKNQIRSIAFTFSR